MLVERGAAEEQPHAQALSAAVVLKDEREAEPLRRLGDVLLSRSEERRVGRGWGKPKTTNKRASPVAKRLDSKAARHFQAEDGIRDGHVTGVQTCALPISPRIRLSRDARRARRG